MGRKKKTKKKYYQILAIPATLWPARVIAIKLISPSCIVDFNTPMQKSFLIWRSSSTADLGVSRFVDKCTINIIRAKKEIFFRGSLSDERRKNERVIWQLPGRAIGAYICKLFSVDERVKASSTDVGRPEKKDPTGNNAVVISLYFITKLDKQLARRFKKGKNLHKSWYWLLLLTPAEISK